MDAVPRSVDAEQVERGLASIEGVNLVHDLHIWSASTSQTTATAHLAIENDADHATVLAAATDLLQHEHGIGHTTIQLEEADHAATCNPPHGDATADGHDHP